jgi:hypothetical protein
MADYCDQPVEKLLPLPTVISSTPYEAGLRLIDSYQDEDSHSLSCHASLRG